MVILIRSSYYCYYSKAIFSDICFIGNNVYAYTTLKEPQLSTYKISKKNNGIAIIILFLFYVRPHYCRFDLINTTDILSLISVINTD